MDRPKENGVRRKRAGNFSHNDRETLITIVNSYRNTVENKKVNHNISFKERNDCWEKITQEFNSAVGGRRETAQIRKAWDNIKRIYRKSAADTKQALFLTGGGSEVKVPEAEYADSIVADILGKSATGLPPSGDSDDIEIMSQVEIHPIEVEIVESTTGDIVEAYTPPVGLNRYRRPSSSYDIFQPSVDTSETSDIWANTYEPTEDGFTHNKFNKAPPSKKGLHPSVTGNQLSVIRTIPASTLVEPSTYVPAEGIFATPFKKRKVNVELHHPSAGNSQVKAIRPILGTVEEPTSYEITDGVYTPPPRKLKKPDFSKRPTPGIKWNLKKGDDLNKARLEAIRSATRMAEEDHQLKKEKNEREKEQNEREKEKNEREKEKNDREREQNEREKEKHRLWVKKMELEIAVLEAQFVNPQDL